MYLYRMEWRWCGGRLPKLVAPPFIFMWARGGFKLDAGALFAVCPPLACLFLYFPAFGVCGGNSGEREFKMGPQGLPSSTLPNAFIMY